LCSCHGCIFESDAKKLREPLRRNVLFALEGLSKRPELPLQAIGQVPFRPLGKSHFKPAPWLHTGDNAYVPSDMSVLAFSKGVDKYLEPFVPLDPGLKDRLYVEFVTRMAPFWQGDNFSSYEEAVKLLDMTKSPGFPYYYQAENKADCLFKYGDLIKDQVERILAGEELPMIFSLTLKDELRPVEKVEQHKTRVFCASDLVHLLCSKQLFHHQNNKLVKTVGQHPVTIGIQIPGSQYVSVMLKHSPKANGSDIGGCDARFNLDFAEIIRDVRKAYIEKQYHLAVDLLYNAVYCGYAVGMGVLYVILHNKSGWENTAHDTSLMVWMGSFAACCLLNLDFDRVMQLNANGDDGIQSFLDDRIDIVKLADTLLKFNVHLEYDSPVPLPLEDVIYLSHQLVTRFIPRFGDVIVAGGNLAKLKSSLNWVRTSETLSYSESALSHLLGLRICLWPWYAEFVRVEEILDMFLQNVERTPLMNELLRSRIPEDLIVQIHLRLEEVNFSPCLLNQDFDVNVTSLIKEHLECMKKQQQKPSKAQRAAQSERDKKAAAEKSKLGARVKGQPGIPGTNNTRSTTKHNNQPKISNSRRGIVVRNREYVNDFNTPGAAGALTVVALQIQPGNVTLFQWLSQLALCFEKYVFRKLKFLWETESPTTNGGKVIYSWDPNVADAQPTTKQQMLVFDRKSDDAPWRCFELDVPHSEIHGVVKEFFVRDTFVPVNADLKLYDCGLLFIGLVGVDSTISTGELHIEYEIELITPTEPPISADLSATINSGGTLSPANFLGTAAFPTNGSSLAFIKNNANVGAVEIDFLVVGQFLLQFSVTGTGLTAANPTIAARTAVLIGPSNNGNPVTIVVNSAGTLLTFTYLVTAQALKNGTPANIALNIGATTVTGGGVRIMPYNNALN
jgi:hypothetical protein